MILMATYGLWYFKVQNEKYETFANMGTPSELKERGFTYAVSVNSPRYEDIPESGTSYWDGYRDGEYFGRWLDPYLVGIDYLVVIPVLSRASSNQVRGINYWKGWVDGIFENTSGYQVGFYWGYESPWQIIDEIHTDRVVPETELADISDYIRNDKGQLFIWSPYTNGTINLDGTDIKTIWRYFNYVFVQPNYYQTCTRKGTTGNTYSFSELVDVLNWIWNATPNTYLTLEADRSVLGQQEHCRCLSSICECSLDRCIDYAGDYVLAQMNSVVQNIWPQRMYYFSVDLGVVDTVREKYSLW
ncbi:hypothetical protein [Thermococcus sp.]